MAFGKKGKDKNEKIKALKVSPGLDKISLVDISVNDEMGKDPNYNKEYALSESTILFNDGKTTQSVYLLDGAKGVSLKMERSDKTETVGEGHDATEVSLMTLTTSPRKVASILDTTLMQRAYTLRPDKRSLVIMWFVGIIMGFITGLVF
jgi:hypothetical protein